MNFSPKKKKDTSWETVSSQYEKFVSSGQSYFHEHLIMPNLSLYFQRNHFNSILDLGCGQGILSEIIPVGTNYYGVDAAKSLIHLAQKKNQDKEKTFFVFDLCKPMVLDKKDFDLAVFLLSLQNMQQPNIALQNAAKHLVHNGKLLLVLNHPAFRIPQQSGWYTPTGTTQQNRWIARYLSFMEISLKMNPAKKEKSAITWSYHFSLQQLSFWLNEAGFVICKIEEWASNKTSFGKHARVENFARQEIPMFMFLECQKIN